MGVGEAQVGVGGALEDGAADGVGPGHAAAPRRRLPVQRLQLRRLQRCTKAHSSLRAPSAFHATTSRACQCLPVVPDLR